MTTFTPMTEAELDAWIVELLHGGREQVTSQLRKSIVNYVTGDTTGFGYCCLGVRCDMVGFDLDSTYLSTPGDEWSEDVFTPFAEHGGDTEDENLPEPLRSLSVKTRRALAEANDEGHTFADIAHALNLHREVILTGGDLDYRHGKLAVAA